MITKLDKAMREHKRISDEVATLEKGRDHDRTEATWQEIKRLKKEKLRARDLVESILKDMKPSPVALAKSKHRTVIFEKENNG